MESAWVCCVEDVCEKCTGRGNVYREGLVKVTCLSH